MQIKPRKREKNRMEDKITGLVKYKLVSVGEKRSSSSNGSFTISENSRHFGNQA